MTCLCHSTGHINECLDIDECENHELNNCEMLCTNTGGSYLCGCSQGYRLSSDSRSCEDINECVERTAPCQHGCDNTIGGFSCRCFDGFTPNETNPYACVEEVNANTVCNHLHCEYACRAINSSTGPLAGECFCPTGYDLNPADNVTCMDHDECQDSARACSQVCNNTEGGFSCSCYSGFHLDSDQRTCIPCPEMKFGPNCNHDCYCHGHGERCDSITGCICQPGWTGSGCENDIDECDGPPVCPEGQVCTNNKGSFTCRCQQGYVLNTNGTCIGKLQQSKRVFCY